MNGDVAASARAFPALLRTGFADAVAYRAEFLVWVLTTNMPLVMLALWNAVARDAPVGNWSGEGFVAYYLGALIVRLVTSAWVAWEMTFEIRQGVMPTRLLRPLNPLVHYAAENLAALPLRALVSLPVAAILLYTVGRAQLTQDPVLLAVFALSLAGAWLLTFLAMATIGSLAMLVQSAVSLVEVWFGLFSVLSGYLVPLDLLPKWLAAIAAWLPFQLLLSFPVRTLLGRISRADALGLLGLQAAYVAVFFLLLTVVWREGTRRYSAFGG